MAACRIYYSTARFLCCKRLVKRSVSWYNTFIILFRRRRHRGTFAAAYRATDGQDRPGGCAGPFFADLLSPAAIFAAIGAIVAMNRTVGDVFQLLHTVFRHPVGRGLRRGVCQPVRGVPLYRRRVGVDRPDPALCGAQAAVCGAAGVHRVRVHLPVPGGRSLFYVWQPPAGHLDRLGHRPCGCIALKPYNNRARITEQFTHFLQSVPAMWRRVSSAGGIRMFPRSAASWGASRRSFPSLQNRNVFRLPDHRTQAVYLRGEQLANALLQELTALCAMDEKGRLSPENAEKLSALGLHVPDTLPRRCKATRMWWAITTCPACLQAYHYLSEFNLTGMSRPRVGHPAWGNRERNVVREFKTTHGKEKEKQFFQPHRLCARRGRLGGGAGQHLALPLSCGKVWRRHLPAGLPNPGGHVRLCADDHRNRDRPPHRPVLHRRVQGAGQAVLRLGWLASLVPVIITPYYCVIGGWVIKYFADYLSGSGALAEKAPTLTSIGFAGEGLFATPLP